jgi:hypothetical protein
MRGVAPGAAIIAALVLSVAAYGTEDGGRDGRVKDPVLARLVSLVESGFVGTVSREQLTKWATSGKSKLPLDRMARLNREQLPGGASAEVQVVFGEELDVPFPYGLLGYKPGRLLSSPVLRLREWDMGDVTFEHAARDGADVILEDVRIFRLVEGSAEADFHTWVDKLLGPALEDTELEGLFFYRDRGSPRGAVVGTTPGGKVHVGVFDLERDGAVFPTPAEIKVIGGRLYHWMLRQTAG